jgi:hypothetical protein
MLVKSPKSENQQAQCLNGGKAECWLRVEKKLSPKAKIDELTV